MASAAFVAVAGFISGRPALIVKYLITVERTVRCGNQRSWCKKKKTATRKMVQKMFLE